MYFFHISSSDILVIYRPRLFAQRLQSANYPPGCQE